MKTMVGHVSQKGQVVIPASIRKELNLTKGSEFLLRCMTIRLRLNKDKAQKRKQILKNMTTKRKKIISQKTASPSCKKS